MKTHKWQKNIKRFEIFYNQGSENLTNIHTFISPSQNVYHWENKIQQIAKNPGKVNPKILPMFMQVRPVTMDIVQKIKGRALVWCNYFSFKYITTPNAYCGDACISYLACLLWHYFM